MSNYKTPVLKGKKKPPQLNSSIPFMLSPPLHESTKIGANVTPLEKQTSKTPSENKKSKPKRVRRNYNKFKVGHEIDKKEGWVDDSGKLITVKDRIDALFKPKSTNCNTPVENSPAVLVSSSSSDDTDDSDLPPDPRYPVLLQSSITTRDIYDCQRLVTRLNFIKEDMDKMVKETSPRIEQKIKDIGERKREILEMAKEKLECIDRNLQKHIYPSASDASCDRQASSYSVKNSFFTRPSFDDFEQLRRKRPSNEPVEPNQQSKQSFKRRRTIGADLSVIGSSDPNPDTCKPKGFLVTTSLHEDEQLFVSEAVKKLGGFTIQNDVSRTTTHVVCGAPRRTMNVLRAICRGCWIVSNEWISSSLDAGHWLPEEEFEAVTCFTNCRATRLARQEADTNVEHTAPTRRTRGLSKDDDSAHGLSEVLPIFRSAGGIYISPDLPKPKPAEVAHLIRLCAGRVVQKVKEARVVIAKNHSGRPKNASKSSVIVKPNWLLDSIMATQSLPFDIYLAQAS